MVFFELVKQSDGTYTYAYYPEKHLDKKPGVMVFSDTGELISFEPAEEDYEVVATVESDLEWLKIINEDRIARGEPTITLEEWKPFDKDQHYYAYSSHCISVISKSIKAHKPIQQDVRMWY